MEKKVNITEWLDNFNKGLYDSPDVTTQIDAGWYDWFCKDSSLANKTQVLGKKLVQISKSDKFDNDKTYVFFKNNCPMSGSLYDDFRICDIETGDVIFTITPSCGHNSSLSGKKSTVWGQENSFDEPIVKGSWKDVKDFFLK